MSKFAIYQVLPRLFGNYNTTANLTEQYRKTVAGI